MTGEVLACQDSETLCWVAATPDPLAAMVGGAFEALLAKERDADVLPLA